MPEQLQALERRFRALRAEENLTAMRALLDEAHEQFPDDPGVPFLDFQYHQTLGHWQECVSIIRRQRERGIDSRSLRLSEAGCLERMLRPDEALALLDGIKPDEEGWHASVYCFALEQQKRYDDILERLTRNGRLDVPGNAYGAALLKSCARSLEHRQRYAEAFQVADQANQLQRRLSRFRPGSGVAMARVTAFCRLLERHADVLSAEPVPVDERPDPVFLVGFPRSGTTLLEQALDAHSALQAFEEPPTVEQMINLLTREQLEQEGVSSETVAGDSDFWARAFHAALNGDEKLIARLRDRYFEIAGLLGHDEKSGRVMLDKMPLNSIYLPLLARIFPKARFIVALRHPCDSVVSAWMRYFNDNDGMVHFLSLETAALLYDQAIRILEAGARQEAVKGRCHWVYYENLVDDFPGQLSAVFASLGLEWEDEVLNYADHARSRGTLKTPSVDSVTGGISGGAIGRWHHYRNRLGHALPLLRRSCDILGYSQDQQSES